MRDFGNRWVVYGSASAVLFFLYAPLLVMMFFSFNNSNYTSLPFRGFTLHWYYTFLADGDLIASIWNSLYVGIGVVCLSVLFGVPAAIALERYEFPGKTAFRRIVLLPIVLPGVITGLSLLIFYVALGFHLSLYTIMLGQGTGLMCITITEVFARLESLGRSRLEAAKDLGANEWESFWRVIVPSIRSSVVGAMLITFAISFDEIAVTYLLTGTQNTLPMQLWSMLRREATPEINAVASVVVIGSVFLIVGGVMLSRRGTLLQQSA